MKTERMKRTTNAFNYYLAKELEPKDGLIVVMPVVSPNARGVNDIGYTCEDTVNVFATIDENYDDENAHWQEIKGDEINRTSKAVKFINTSGNKTRVVLRALLY